MFACHSCSVRTACVKALMVMYRVCLREQGSQRYTNTYVDRQVGKTIKMLGPSVVIGHTFLGLTPSTEYINTFRPLNLMIAIRM